MDRRLRIEARREVEDFTDLGRDRSVGLGFRTKLLRAAMATGNIQADTMTGKLNGVMPATTPSG